MSVYEFVKKQLSAKEVVKEILGEPQKTSGDNYFWSSPFREGDNDPSLCVNEEKITDFGDETFRGQDIFNFVSRYKGISNEDALRYIIKTYNIDVPENYDDFTKSTLNTENNITYKYILEPTYEKANEIYCMFDTMKYSQKPNGNEIGSIKNRISSIQPMVYTIDNIKQKILAGQTCIPSAIKSQAEWQDDINWLQLFFVDVDNVNSKREKLMVDNEKHVTVEKMLEYCKKINLLPTFIYYTFSHSEKQHKFRLVYALNIGTQKQKEIKGIYEFLKETFKAYNIDTAPTSIASMFFGGISIAYESDIFYHIKQEPVQIIVANANTNKLPALIKSGLNYSQYVVCNDYIGTFNKNNEFKPIANFIPYCTEKLIYKNGQDTEVFYLINCLLLDSKKQINGLVISTEQYQKFNFVLGNWDKDCIICAGTINNDKLREIAQRASRKIMVEKEVYSHTGFIRKDNKLCYLYHGGVIGDVDNISVDLSRDQLQQYCFTDKEFDLQEALKRSLSFLDVADKDITIPIIATVYVAPLVSLLKKEHINVDIIAYVHGKTGTRKSSIVALALSHYGNFDRDNFPSSFRDTYNSIEKKSFILKDIPNVIDDYNPEAVGNKKLATIQEVYAMYGDRTGRTRMKQDTTLRSTYIARGVCFITGETIPDVPQSRIARSITINVKEDSIDLAKLTKLQENSEELSFCEKKYIEWIIQNEIQIMEQAKIIYKNIRLKQKEGIHGRTIELLASLMIGFKCFTLFMLDKNIITTDEKNNLDEEAYNTMEKLVEQQTQMVQELKPTEMFYNALEQLFATNSISVKDYYSKEVVEYISMGGISVGYYDNKEELFYFYPDIIYSQIQNFYNHTGNKFPINKTTLWKYLFEEGNLYRTDKSRYYVKRDGKTVVAVKKANLEFDIYNNKHQITQLRRTDIFDGNNVF